MKRPILAVAILASWAAMILALAFFVSHSRPRRVIFVIPSPEMEEELNRELTSVFALTGYEINLWVRVWHFPKTRADCEDLLRQEFAILGLELDPDPATVKSQEEAVLVAGDYSDLCFERCRQLPKSCLDAFCLGYFCGTIPLLAETISEGKEDKAKETMQKCINQAEKAMKQLGLPDEVSEEAEKLRRKLSLLKSQADYRKFSDDVWHWYESAYKSLARQDDAPDEDLLPDGESGTIEILCPQAPHPACGFFNKKRGNSFFANNKKRLKI